LETQRNKVEVGDILASMPGSDRIVIMNAARNVIYRGYAANALESIDTSRKVDRMKQAMEVYRKEEVLWDWTRIKELPQSLTPEQTLKYSTDQLTQFVFTEIQLANIYES
jgi:hypothetical protein